jgi:hypothetical protein
MLDPTRDYQRQGSGPRLRRPETSVHDVLRHHNVGAEGIELTTAYLGAGGGWSASRLHLEPEAGQPIAA